jgi:hypothetical protein
MRDVRAWFSGRGEGRGRWRCLVGLVLFARAGPRAMAGCGCRGAARLPLVGGKPLGAGLRQERVCGFLAGVWWPAFLCVKLVHDAASVDPFDSGGWVPFVAGCARDHVSPFNLRIG